MPLSTTKTKSFSKNFAEYEWQLLYHGSEGDKKCVRKVNEG